MLVSQFSNRSVADLPTGEKKELIPEVELKRTDKNVDQTSLDVTVLKFLTSLSSYHCTQ